MLIQFDKEALLCKKAGIITSCLEECFPEVRPTLIAPNPFCFLISVMLSAQCTDKVVNSVTSTLFEHADNPWDMVKLDRALIEVIISKCGMFRKKSKAILGISRLLIDNFNGAVPSDIDMLQKLPLVGRKTALVVRNIVFSIPSFPVDTHIMRCSNRWGISESRNPFNVERALCEMFDKSLWSKLHLQMIAFGRKYCRARQHIACPICDQIKVLSASFTRS